MDFSFAFLPGQLLGLVSLRPRAEKAEVDYEKGIFLRTPPEVLLKKTPEPSIFGYIDFALSLRRCS
jgi:hypothetical protein